METKFILKLAAAFLLFPGLSRAQRDWPGPLRDKTPQQIRLSAADIFAPAPSARAESSCVDTANTAAPEYVNGFSLRRDVFSRAMALERQGLKVLVAWDIDLTLGTPLHPGSRVSLGSDPWWNEQTEALVKVFTTAYGPRKDAGGKLLWTAEAQSLYDARYAQLIQLNNTLHEQIALEPVEAFVPYAIRQAQAEGVAMMAVTSRGPDMEGATLQDLAVDVGVDFSRSAPGGSGFLMVNFRINEKARLSTYRKGVLQTSGQNKGEQLLYVFSAAGYRPDVVFFMDDTVKNTRDVFLALKNAGIAVHTVRYGFEDPRVEEYRAEGSPQPCVAQAQLRAFRQTGRFPPDAGVSGAKCDFAQNLNLIYGTEAPAAAN